MPGRGHAYRRADVGSSAFARSVSCVFSALFCLFQGRFLVMVVLTQALVVGRVNKQPPVPAMGLDVVHHRSTGTVAGISWRILSGALPAKRLPQELSRTQVICPDRQAVPAMPLGGDPAARFYRLVLGAISITGQRRASWVPARPQGFLCHRAITSGQNKKPAPTRPAICGSCGTGTLAQALVNIHDGLLATDLAEYHVICGSCRWQEFLYTALSTYRANEPSILCD